MYSLFIALVAPPPLLVPAWRGVVRTPPTPWAAHIAGLVLARTVVPGSVVMAMAATKYPRLDSDGSGFDSGNGGRVGLCQTPGSFNWPIDVVSHGGGHLRATSFTAS